MRKLKIKTLFIIELISIITWLIVTASFFSCQPKDDILKNAKFPCKCTYKSTTDYAIKFKCQRKQPSYFKSESYHKKIKLDSVIYEPLN